MRTTIEISDKHRSIFYEDFGSSIFLPIRLEISPRSRKGRKKSKEMNLLKNLRAFVRDIFFFGLSVLGQYPFCAYSVSDNVFGKARERNPSKSYILVRRRGTRPITQSKIFIWRAISTQICVPFNSKGDMKSNG